MPQRFFLTGIEKKSIALVLLGTFLEYFDLVLYVHLAVVLNPLFFPSKDPNIQALLAVFTFSAAYVLRPIGSFVFGYVGDKVGRKASIVWTSGLMGFSALVIGCLPPYASIGFLASLLFVFARALQGFSSIGEIISARVFVAEVAERSRHVNFLSTLPAVSIVSGGVAALGIGFLSLKLDPVQGWRWPFLIGSAVAFVGGVIRLHAIESPVFLERKALKDDPTEGEVINFLKVLECRKKNYWCYFAMEAVTPLTFYFCFRYCSDILKGLGLGATDVMAHNFILNVLQVLTLLGWGLLGDFYEPLGLLKKRLWCGFVLVPAFMVALVHFPSAGMIFAVQFLAVFLAGGVVPAQFKIVKAFPVVGRCVNIGSVYAFVHAGMYIVTSVFVHFLDKFYGFWGVGGLFMATLALSLLGVHFFQPASDVVSAHISERIKKGLYEEG